MILLETVARLDEFDKSETIYATAPWTESSEAIVAQEPDSGGLPHTAKVGMKYFLEVSIATEFLEDWSRTLTRPPTIRDKCNRLIHYAINDA
jgi:hypothetical protein